MQRMLQKYGWAISLFIVLVLVILGIVIIVNRSYDELADQSTNFEETQDGTENQNLSGLSKPSPEMFKTLDSEKQVGRAENSELVDDEFDSKNQSDQNEQNVKQEKIILDSQNSVSKPKQDMSTSNSDNTKSSTLGAVDDMISSDNSIRPQEKNDVELEVVNEQASGKPETETETEPSESYLNKEISNSNRAVTAAKLKNQTLETLGIKEKTTSNLSVDPTTSDDSSVEEVKQKKVEEDKALESKEDLSVDVVRVDKSGDAVIAGTTTPNSRVEVLSNDEVVIETESDAEGNFVAMGTVKSMDFAQTLTLRSEKELPANNVGIKSAQEVHETELNDDRVLEKEKDQWVVAENIFVILPNNLFESDADQNGRGFDPVIVQSDSNEIKIVQNKSVVSVKRITIDSISYSDLGEAVLTGRAKPDYKVLIYVDDKFIDSSNVGASGGWSSELTGLSPGVYKLRLDEVDDRGVVRSRIETPFKKVSPDILMNMVSGSITVQPGNSLWRIARRIFGRGIKYIEIYEKNSDLIKDPDLIYPGQVFAIPTKI